MMMRRTTAQQVRRPSALFRNMGLSRAHPSATAMNNCCSNWLPMGGQRLASTLRVKLPLLGETEISLDNDVYRPGVPENPGDLYAPVPAEELIHEVPPKEVHGSTAMCDGGGGALGHPRVFINLDKPGSHACGYCGLRFIKSEHHH